MFPIRLGAGVAGGTKAFCAIISGCGAVLVARLNGVQEAAGSTPVTRTIFILAELLPLVAKLDIAADSDSEGRGFESLRADQIILV